MKPKPHMAPSARPSRLASDGFRLFALGLLFCVSCRTANPLPPADFSAPGWRLRQGQAVWKPSKSRPELAGDLLLAVNTNGNHVVQFSKTPFPLASAQVANGCWQIEFGAGQHSWRGRGTPPARFVWFQLSRVLAGTPADAPWKFTGRADNSWRLENAGTGEFLEGQLFQ
ncbi:MAG: hypothetical protein ABSG78_15815 [Verrucomicrobiota bacterium]